MRPYASNVIKSREPDVIFIYRLILSKPFPLMFQKHPFKIRTTITFTKIQSAHISILELILLRETLQIQ